MKNLSSLTTFFITFMLVVYFGVFAGLKVNSIISGKKLVSAVALPLATLTPKPSTFQLAQVSATKAVVPTFVPVVQSPPLPPPSASNTPVPASSVDTSTPMPSSPPPPPPLPSPSLTPVPSVPPPPPASTRCIIAISGGSYDVTEYRNIHSGGDIFQCGTDMTAAFLSQHPASFLQKMSKYRV